MPSFNFMTGPFPVSLLIVSKLSLLVMQNITPGYVMIMSIFLRFSCNQWYKMTQLTCLACRVIFDNADAQRTHYKTDWHRYNLKRKIAELPPVTYGEFNRIVQFHTEKREEKLQEKVLACQVCSKSFSSDNAYENHLKSKKHKEQSSKSSANDCKKKIGSLELF